MPTHPEACLAALRRANAAGPRGLPIDFPPRLDAANGSLAADVAAVRCLLRSGAAFLLGRPSMGAELRAAHAVRVLRRPPAADPALAAVAGVVESDGASAADFGAAYAAAVALSDLAVRWGHARLPASGGPCDAVGPRPGAGWGCTLAHVRGDALLRAVGAWPHRLVRQQVLEPFWAAEGDGRLAWTGALSGRTVLVVHGFARTIAAQLPRLAAGRVWGEATPRVFPADVRLKLVRAPMNVGGASDGRPGWRASLAALVAQVDGAGRFDVALVACGGVGMLLAAHLRTTNRSAVYVGGWLQVWLGIAGGRWDGLLTKRVGHPLAKAYAANREGWTRPLPVDTPAKTWQVEDSAYWR
ncbi:hypothetical protein AB1Y20_016105 [Prymnesium parvum]|uniref:Uncharacterized protein n=1 Tax=Prymnesium parvum TaxID=97485 RepID=A0AB34K4Y3_PRYPA